jgi:hypothetical protein
MTNLAEYQKKQNIFFLFILFFSSISFALVYKLCSSTLMIFILLGSLSVLTNLIFYFFYSFKYKSNLANDNEEKLIIIIRGLPLVIPFSIFYVFITILFSGFNVPFNY